jgi:hypothetical protein
MAAIVLYRDREVISPLFGVNVSAGDVESTLGVAGEGS